jgi:hypothetical protein
MTASQAVNQRTATVNELKRLRDRYLDLTNRALSQLALAASIPDPVQSLSPTAYPGQLIWVLLVQSFIEKGKEPAYQQLTQEPLERAIKIAESMIEEQDEYTQRLNQNSLRWRRKLG